VSLATFYRYYSSKDHLIAEVHAAESQALAEELRSQPFEADSSVERLESVFFHMLDAITKDLSLASAAVLAITSGDPSASTPEYWQTVVMRPYLDVALGDAERLDREELGEILGHLFLSLMISLTSGHMDVDKAKSIMGRAIRRMLPEG
jgi:AcrR family transcriptional regulator